MIGVQDLTDQLSVMQQTLVQLERRLQRVEAREPARITTDRSHAEQPHAGIIVSQQLPLGELQKRALSLLNSVTAVEMSSNIVNLAEFAVRD